MVSFSANILAFYLGALCMEHAGFICGVTVFLATALVGTIAASGAEKSLASATRAAISRCLDGIAEYSVERLLSGRGI